MEDKIILDADEAAVFNQLNQTVKDAAHAVEVQQGALKQATQHAEAHHRSCTAFIELFRKKSGVEKFTEFSITEEDGKLVIVPTREAKPVNPSAS